MEFNSQYPQQYPHLPSNPNPAPVPQSPWQQATPEPAPQAPWQPPAPAQPVPQPMWQQPQPLPPAPNPEPVAALPSQGDIRPVPVVKVLSPIGVEYVFLTITLFVGAGSLMAVLLMLFNGITEFSALAFPVAALLVTVPLFAFLFLRLKKLELRDPSLKLDPSKRRSTQFTQVVAFLISLFTVIGFIFTLFAKMGGDSHTSVGKAFLDMLAVLLVSGGVLAYYWLDEHKTRR